MSVKCGFTDFSAPEALLELVEDAVEELDDPLIMAEPVMLEVTMVELLSSSPPEPAEVDVGIAANAVADRLGSAVNDADSPVTFLHEEGNEDAVPDT